MAADVPQRTAVGELMAMSPLRHFVVTAAFWLPAMFFLWFAFSSPVVFPVIRIAAAILHAWVPDLVTSMTQDYHHAVFAYIADVGGVAGLPGQRLAVEEQRTNVLIYCYGLPLLYGLVMATPLNWRRTFLQLGVGFVVLGAVQTFGLLGDVFKTMAFGVGPAVQAALASMEYAAVAPAAGAAAEQHMHAALAAHGLGPDLIALGYQFGYLVLPAVTPVALWILMNPRFLESLVGWSREPEAAAAGPSEDGNSRGTSV
jgi:hypothetical protein